jgi:cytochrome c oxidase cbb3-type subunit 3/ubiquinol-cytochrome c reductase cytochrome c subunit
VLSFTTLYRQNCAGCHGDEGVKGVATPIGLPEYQALVDDDTLRNVIANGVPATSMPGFSRAAGGTLTDRQIDALVRGVRSAWSKGDVFRGIHPPAYADATPGDRRVGEKVYDDSCARCHGKVGGRVGRDGSVLNTSFLALVSPQMLRTTVLVGRPDFDMPGWRTINPNHVLSDEEIRDVVAFQLSKRSLTPGQPYPLRPNPSPHSGGNP